jgi:hypothetical protein
MGKKMLKKSFAVLGTVLCLQAAQSMTSDRVSEIHYCEDWRGIREAMRVSLSNSAVNPVVILDCDKIMCIRTPGNCKATDPVLFDVLEELTSRSVPFFCMTTIPSIEYIGRRKDFELAGIAPSFHRGSTVFSRKWRRSADSDKKYFVDTDWNTAYTFRPTGYEYSEENPLNFYDLDNAVYNCYIRRIFDENKESLPSKGFVFSKLIEDGLLFRPGIVVFVDDYLSNLESMQSYCDYLGIAYVGLLCRAYTDDQIE